MYYKWAYEGGEGNDTSRSKEAKSKEKVHDDPHPTINVISGLQIPLYFPMKHISP